MAASLGIAYKNVNYALAINSEALLKLQEQASTGSRVNRPSDDPSSAYRILQLDSDVSRLSNYSDNTGTVVDLLDMSSTAIQNTMDNFAQARTLATQITTGTMNEAQRKVLGQSIDDILEQVVSTANTKHLNNYLFGGSDSDTVPFAVTRDNNGKITAVKYQGSDSARQVEIAPGVAAPASLVGSKVFSSDTPSTPEFYGTTGAQAGTGTSTVTGDAWLTVGSDGTNYKLSLDDGQTWTTVPLGGEANTAVTDSRSGKVLYVDTRQITATGLEAVRVPGSYDAFGVLVTCRDLLTNSRNLSDAQLTELRNTMVTSLDEVNAELARNITSVGGQINTFDNLKNIMDASKSKAQEQADSLGQADIAQVAIDLSRHQTLYQMSMQVAGKLFSISLLDFIS
jgi:flagellar hook-associated protein 3 FlgL